MDCHNCHNREPAVRRRSARLVIAAADAEERGLLLVQVQRTAELVYIYKYLINYQLLNNIIIDKFQKRIVDVVLWFCARNILVRCKF